MSYRLEDYTLEQQAEIHRIIVAGGVDDFSGKNCEPEGDRECSGWDGVSHRCSCGNRRMTWEVGENGHVYAEAY